MAPCEPTKAQLQAALADAQRGRLDREWHLHDRIRRALLALADLPHTDDCSRFDRCTCGLDEARAILRGEQ